MRSKTVVVVEDDPSVRFVAVSLFEDAGVPVLAFANADDALVHMYQNASNVSAIFTDLHMPGHMDGLILAEMVGRHWPYVAVILTSGRVKPLGELPSNVRFISKPWRPEQILAEVQAAVDASKTMFTGLAD